jgi:hypothetical protein
LLTWLSISFIVFQAGENLDLTVPKKYYAASYFSNLCIPSFLTPLVCPWMAATTTWFVEDAGGGGCEGAGAGGR